MCWTAIKGYYKMLSFIMSCMTNGWCEKNSSCVISSTGTSHALLWPDNYSNFGLKPFTPIFKDLKCRKICFPKIFKQISWLNQIFFDLYLVSYIFSMAHCKVQGFLKRSRQKQTRIGKSEVVVLGMMLQTNCTQKCSKNCNFMYYWSWCQGE